MEMIYGKMTMENRRKIYKRRTRRNIYFLTEEKPKISSILSILQIYKNDFGIDFSCNDTPIIMPILHNDTFSYTYELRNISVNGIDNIYIYGINTKI